MFKQIWKYVWLMVVMSMTLAACASQPPQQVVVTQIVNGAQVVVTTTPAPTQSPYDDNAPITVWIDQPRQPAIDAFLKANPQDASLIKAVIVDREQFPSKVLLFQ